MPDGDYDWAKASRIWERVMGALGIGAAFVKALRNM